MNSIIINIALVLLFLTSTLFSKQIVVDRTGQIKTIKEALKTAENYDEILVRSGVYSEGRIEISKKIKLLGENFPVIDGAGRDEVLTVKADDVTISGFIIKNAGVSYLTENAGIKLDSVKNCTVENNKFESNFFAVYLARSSDCKISKNHIQARGTSEAASGNGIHLWYCKNILIEDNFISGHRDGIYFEFVRGGRIINNHSEKNLRYGLHFMFSDNCTYSKNRFNENGAGVAVMYTKNVDMTDNTFDNNWGPASYGILLKEISDSRISENEFIKNTSGIYVEGCNRITIEKNDFENNGWAVKLMANSFDNLFYRNNFISNTFDVSTNSRQNFNSFDQNYWSSYKGYDLNKDGFGDVPYRPVKLFSLIVEQQPPALALLHGFFISLLDAAEAVIPSLTPETLADSKPLMRRVK